MIVNSFLNCPSGLHISVMIMDCPAGCVCHLTRSQRSSFPLSEAICVKSIVPIIELTYRVRLHLLDTVSAIKNDDEIVPIHKKNKQPLLPPCIMTPSSSAETRSSGKKSEKKRKL